MARFPGGKSFQGAKLIMWRLTRCGFVQLSSTMSKRLHIDIPPTRPGSDPISAPDAASEGPGKSDAGMASVRGSHSPAINPLDPCFDAGTSEKSASPSGQLPALEALARLLGHQAGRHFQKNRYEGLGRVRSILVERDGVYLIKSFV
jgi:hypothetical protein